VQNSQDTIPVAVDIQKQWQALVLSDDRSCWKVDSQNVRELLRNKLPEYAIVKNLRLCPAGANPLNYDVILKGVVDTQHPAGHKRHLPMCFDKLDEAFMHLDCPLDNIRLSAPITRAPTSVTTELSFPSVNSVSLEWRLNTKQHAAFIVLCATLLRRHVVNTSSTIQINQRYNIFIL